MTNDEMLRESASLPAIARREVEDFVAFLSTRYRSATIAPTDTIGAEEFIGLWRDRDGMSDSSGWVREVREKHWAN
jgi:hypothetical protein